MREFMLKSVKRAAEVFTRVYAKNHQTQFMIELHLANFSANRISDKFGIINSAEDSFSFLFYLFFIFWTRLHICISIYFMQYRNFDYLLVEIISSSHD